VHDHVHVGDGYGGLGHRHKRTEYPKEPESSGAQKDDDRASGGLRPRGKAEELRPRAIRKKRRDLKSEEKKKVKIQAFRV